MSKVQCSHCHLEYDSAVMITESINNKEYHFCCKGCQGIFTLLHAQGLDSFYHKLGTKTLQPPSNSLNALETFDTDAFKREFIKEKKGFYEVSLIIEGIHCAACVWLNERILHEQDGIIEAHINYTNNKATITYDSHALKLSEIITLIRSIGYDAYAYDAKIAEEKVNKERKNYYIKMAVAIFASMNVMWIAIAQYAGYFTGISQEVKTILHVAEWILSTPVLFFSGWVFFKGAYYGMRNSIVNMDVLVASGALLTYIYSIYITLTESGEAYFDSVTMIITFVLIGKFLEVLSKKGAADTLDKFGKHLPQEVMRKGANGVERISVHDVQVGDIIELKAGEKVSLDGIIRHGVGSFDESNITGESIPIKKAEGEHIISGSHNLESTVIYEVSKDYSSSTMSVLKNLLDDALRHKPKIEQFANKLSGHFSSIILLLALLTFAGWFMYVKEFEEAFIVGISVIIIACPCALALATPVATLVGLGVGSKRGILFKEAAFLESMAKTDVLVLDKTGTITEGKPRVVQEQHIRDFDKNLLYSLVSHSNHPIAIGVLNSLKTCKVYNLESVRTHTARGLSAKYKGVFLAGGNAEYMRELGIHNVTDFEHSTFYFAIDNELVAEYELKDMPKQEALEQLSKIKASGVELVMLTGDHEEAALAVAQSVGIERLKASLKPEDKASFVEELIQNGHNVVMVGDGLNDTLALSKANLGIAMGSGSDVAIEVSDIVLLDSSLKSLQEAFSIAKTTFAFVKQNLFISLIYNVITIPLAMMGYIIPLIAAISMSFSSLLVVLNALRIKVSWRKS